MNMGDLSIIWCFFKCLSSAFYSFHCRGLSLCYVYSYIFNFFEVIVNKIVFPYIEKLLIFVYWFCILMVLPKCLSDPSFLMKSLESFKYKIISSTNRDNLISSFPICIPFISSSCFIALAKNSRTIVNKSD
jgi:hypothetical protein